MVGGLIRVRRRAREPLTQEHDDQVDLQGVGETQRLAQGLGEGQAVQTGLIKDGHGLDHSHRW